jgi:hypothetical protein
VWFISYAHDHPPPHVHGAYAGTVVIIDLLSNGNVRKADRMTPITPRNAKSGDVKKILDVAAERRSIVDTLGDDAWVSIRTT